MKTRHYFYLSSIVVALVIIIAAARLPKEAPATVNATVSQPQKTVAPPVTGNVTETRKMSPAEEKILSIKEIMALPQDDPRKKTFFLDIMVRDLPGQIKEDDALLFSRLSLSASTEQDLINLLVFRDLLHIQALDYMNKTDVNIKVTIPASTPGGKPQSTTVLANTGDTSSMASHLKEVNDYTDGLVKELIGAAKFPIYEHFIETEYLRNRTSHIPQITDDQEEQLLSVLQPENTPQRYYTLSILSDSSIQAARAFLTEKQISYLIEMQDRNSKLDNAAVAALASGNYPAPK